MKKLMYGVIASLAIIVTVNAATYVASVLTADSREVIDEPAIITGFSLYSTNTVPTIVRLYDGGTTVVVPAHDTVSSYVTNIISTYITSTGLTNTVTNASVYFYETEVEEATNPAVAIATIVVPANGDIISQSGLDIRFGQSVYLSNDAAGISGVITYQLP